MKHVSLLLVFLILNTTISQAQKDLFKSEKTPAKKGFVIAINGDVDFPGGDMAKRFGTSYRAGAGFFYKTASNLMFGPKFDFIFGDKIKEDSLMINLKDANGSLISQDGQKIGVGVFQRGYAVGLQIGKTFNISKTNADNGILVMTGVGFIQHKINIFDRTGNIPQIKKEFRKGYDRLTNGIYIEQFVGYNHFSNNGLINFHIGLDIMAGFTKGRRDYLYDVMQTDDKSRVDLLFGIRGGWYIPIFKRKSEDIFFE
jgi:hypothetical protein